MLETRRKFLMIIGATSASLSFLADASVPQVPKGTQRLPADTDDDAGPPKAAAKGVLEENDKDIKKKIEKLYELAGALKEEIEKTDSAKVLSLAMVKKAEEIEKLAHAIKTRARG